MVQDISATSEDHRWCGLQGKNINLILFFSRFTGLLGLHKIVKNANEFRVGTHPNISRQPDQQKRALSIF